MKEILNRIETWFKEHLPEVLADLNSGATESEIEFLENQIGIQLPILFRDFYKWHNGQKCYPNSGLFYGLDFLNLDRIFEQWKMWSDLIDDAKKENEPRSIFYGTHGKSHMPGTIKEMYANKKWIPFAYDGGGNHLGIDFDPGENGTVGQIINFGRDEDTKFVLADDFQRFLNWLITHLESGNYIIRVSAEGQKNFYTMKPEMEHFLDSLRIIYQGHL